MSLTEPGVLGAGYQHWSDPLESPSVSAAQSLPAGQPTAAPEPARQKLLQTRAQTRTMQHEQYKEPHQVYYRKAHTSAVFSLAVMLFCAACRLSSIDFSFMSCSWIL